MSAAAAWFGTLRRAGGWLIGLLTFSGCALALLAADRVTEEERRIFQQSSPAVFRVNAGADIRQKPTSPAGLLKLTPVTGTVAGFLIDPSGLIVTPITQMYSKEALLTRASANEVPRYISLEVERGTRVLAEILAHESADGIAVVRVNPQVVAAIRPLSLAGPDATAEVEFQNIKLLAVGCPESGQQVMQVGTVRDIRRRTSRVPGEPCSGSPVLNLQGEVEGVLVSWLPASRSTHFIHIGSLSELLAEARRKAGEFEVPSAGPLPPVPETPYAATTMRQVEAAEAAGGGYHARAGNVHLEFLTPPLLHSLPRLEAESPARSLSERRKKRGQFYYDQGTGFFWWRQHEGSAEPVVIVQAVPRIRMDRVSVLDAVGELFALSYLFKPEFVSLRLSRAGEEVRPIEPARTCGSFVAWFTRPEDARRLRDDLRGCYGTYKYPAEAFKPGVPIHIQIFSEDALIEPDVVVLSDETVNRIWSDFAPYFKSVDR